MSRRMRHPTLPYCNVIYLEDGASSLFSRKKDTPCEMYRVDRLKTIETLEWDAAAAKNGFEHFMLKEIMEIPDVIGNTPAVG